MGSCGELFKPKASWTTFLKYRTHAKAAGRSPLRAVRNTMNTGSPFLKLVPDGRRITAFTRSGRGFDIYAVLTSALRQALPHLPAIERIILRASIEVVGLESPFITALVPCRQSCTTQRALTSSWMAPSSKCRNFWPKTQLVPMILQPHSCASSRARTTQLEVDSDNFLTKTHVYRYSQHKYSICSI